MAIRLDDHTTRGLRESTIEFLKTGRGKYCWATDAYHYGAVAKEEIDRKIAYLFSGLYQQGNFDNPLKRLDNGSDLEKYEPGDGIVVNKSIKTVIKYIFPNGKYYSVLCRSEDTEYVDDLKLLLERHKQINSTYTYNEDSGEFFNGDVKVMSNEELEQSLLHANTDETDEVNLPPGL